MEFIIIGLLVYFLPAIIAAIKKKRNLAAIIILNILTGWTFIGWIIALIWSITSDNNQNLSVNVNSAPMRSDIEELEKLAELKKKKVITQEEFQEKKKAILNLK